MRIDGADRPDRISNPAGFHVALSVGSIDSKNKLNPLITVSEILCKLVSCLKIKKTKQNTTTS